MTLGYNLYGLNVNAGFKLVRFQEGKPYENPDVVVEIGKIDRPVSDLPDTAYTLFTTYNKDFYYQEIPGVAQFLIKGKNKLIVEPCKNQTVNVITLFFMDAILPILLLRNGLFVMRASAVNTEKGTYLFSSQRGKGKSCIAAYLSQKGYSFVSDDLCVLKFDDARNKFLIKCHHPYSYLWRNTIQLILGSKLKEYEFQQVRTKILKFAIDYNRHACKTDEEVKGIIFLNPVNEAVETSFVQMEGMQKIRKSKNMIHSQHVAKVMLQAKELFRFSDLVTKHVDLIMLKRSRVCGLPKLTKFVIDEIFATTE